MSSLWTPGGERPVGREPAAPASAPPPVGEPFEAFDDEAEDPEVEARLAELRVQLAQTPVSGIVAQVAYQLFEVAALHLSLQPPQLEQAQLGIDAMAGLVESLGDRLGEHAGPLREGLSQIRMAFVQIKNQQGSGDGGAPAPPPTDPAAPAPPQS